MALSASRSVANLKAEQTSLERLRPSLAQINVKDLVPILVARHVLRTHEMRDVYSRTTEADQVDRLIALLKTKSHWTGPLIDALIRSGQSTVANELIVLQKAQ